MGKIQWLSNTEKQLEKLRDQRNIECFKIVDRGFLWHNSLTAKQKQELQQWYNAWLDVTSTKSIPIKPKWLK